MARARITQDARDLYADALAQEGRAYEKIAQQVRDGFSNIWVEPALRAIDRALDEGRQEPDPQDPPNRRAR